ncbi:cyclase family protein [Saccharibacillus sacchari]|uniref:Cyclase family protein n=1 Tax=Saccharibacillus sacchari TaxID=456493 RepID=A0ACC6PEM5_9BACL
MYPGLPEVKLEARELLIYCPLGTNGLITVNELMKAEELYEADILIFNIGHWKYRETDFYRYAHDFPAVPPEAAECIRTQLPKCKALAIDTLSIENLNEAQHNGYFVHHAFLDHEKYEQPIMLIYEDTNPVPLIGKKLVSAFAAPLRIKNHDASVVNIIVEIEESSCAFFFVNKQIKIRTKHFEIVLKRPKSPIQLEARRRREKFSERRL